MRAAEELSYADAHFVACNGCGQKIAAGTVEALRYGQGRWKYDGAGVEDGTVVDVILLGEVRGGGVYERGE